MKSLPINVDLLLVDINTHFYMSVKRKDQLKEFCDFVNVAYKRFLYMLKLDGRVYCL